MQDVTFIIMTKNEELNIVDCINSVKGFAKRVIVLDSFSTDKTCEIAGNLGVEVVQHEFTTHARQFNWGLDNLNINTKWVFHLDADERLTPKLIEQLSKLMVIHDNDDVTGITLEAWLYFMGRKIKHGCHNKRKIMLFKFGYGRLEDRKIDEHLILSEGRSVYCKERFIHYDFKNLNHWIDKMNWYATREVDDYYEYLSGKDNDITSTTTEKKGNDAAISKTRKKKYGFYYKLPKFFRCWMLFIYNYIFKLGFLDGKEGFIYNFMYHRWYRTLVDSKILERKINKNN